MWYLWPAAEGCSFLPHIWDRASTLHVNVEMRQNESPRLSGVLGLLRRVSHFLGKILRQDNTYLENHTSSVMYLPVQVHVRIPFYFLQKKMQGYLLQVFVQSLVAYSYPPYQPL